MLHEFLSAHRIELVDRCRSKAGERFVHAPSELELEHGIPRFLEQVIKTLQVETTSDPMSSRRVSGPSGGARSAGSEIGETAARHGRELLRNGFTIDQVVHDYGDLCQAITDLAAERKVPIEVDEFRTLNRCLDNAIAVAVMEYNGLRELKVVGQRTHELNERLGFFAHELRNMLATGTLALSAIKSGNVGFGGATGAVLDRSLVGLRNLIDGSLTEVRIAAGLATPHQLFALADFIAEIKLSASLEAQLHECTFSVSPVDPTVGISADRHLLSSALSNVLQNAFKFTRFRSEVSLTTHAYADRVLIDVRDHCGGLPVGDAERLFAPHAQHGTDKTGLGLGLTIARRSVEANHGTLSVRDIPGSGCVFTINVPRRDLIAAPTV
jgi:signal transduction histidine kinase